MKKGLLIILILGTFSTLTLAQYEEDTESVDSIIAALYASISGDAGEQRDWDRFRNLFVEDAKLVPTFTNPDGEITLIQWGIEEYVERVDEIFLRDGFHEDEISRETDTFRYVTQVFSTYQSKRTIDGDVFARGINSIQLYNDGNRWWVLSVFWSAESDEYPIPEQYLKEY